MDAIYRPWLDAAARHLRSWWISSRFQTTKEWSRMPLASIPGPWFFSRTDSVSMQRNCCWSACGRKVADWSTCPPAGPLFPRSRRPRNPRSLRWPGTSRGLASAKAFFPRLEDDGRQLTPDGFRKLLDAAGLQFLRTDETGDPAGRAWTEDGQLDKLGHSLQAKLAGRIDEQIDLLVERIEALLETGWRESASSPTTDGCGFPEVCRRSTSQVPDAEPMGTLRGHPGRFDGRGATVPWYWNTSERVAIGPGIACSGPAMRTPTAV